MIAPLPDIPIRLHLPHELFAQRGADGSPTAPARTQDEPPNGAWYALALRALSLQTAEVGDALLAPALLAHKLTPHAYQLRVVRDVFSEKKPAAILADEVGLGKTIEAGLILKELRLRGAARTVLVIAPKALLTQWQDALQDLFEEDFVLADERRFTGFATEERVICSYGQLVSAFESASARTWDCLIADEAHLLANPDARRRRCVADLPTRWRLFLTATPVQNHITDLYSLVDLAVPGRLGTLRQFVSTYVADGSGGRALVPDKIDELRAIAGEVMCRTRRSDTQVAFVPRRVDTYLVDPSAAEAALNADVTRYLRVLYRQAIDIAPLTSASRAPRARAAKVGGLSDPSRQRDDTVRADGSRAGGPNRATVLRELAALQQSLSSSPQAIAAALRARAERHAPEQRPLLQLAERGEHLAGAKEALVVEALGTLGSEPALIFTLRLETARRLREVIARSGRSVECYTGALEAVERRDLVTRFNAGELLTLVATDAGAEGLNLHERCCIVFNYDLHWNPMKMEQRIGRVHRLGQRREVRVVNLAVRGTIDEYVLKLLQDKMRLFDSTIGELDSVLADVQNGELDLEDRLLEIWLRAEDTTDLAPAVLALGDDIEQARSELATAERRTAEVLG